MPAGPSTQQESRAGVISDEEGNAAQTGSADKNNLLQGVQGHAAVPQGSITGDLTTDIDVESKSIIEPSGEIEVEDSSGYVKYTLSTNLSSLCKQEGRNTPKRIYSGLICCPWCNPKLILKLHEDLTDKHPNNQTTGIKKGLNAMGTSLKRVVCVKQLDYRGTLFRALGAIEKKSKTNVGCTYDAESIEPEGGLEGYFKVKSSDSREFKIYFEPKGSDSEDYVTTSSESEGFSEDLPVYQSVYKSFPSEEIEDQHKAGFSNNPTQGTLPNEEDSKDDSVVLKDGKERDGDSVDQIIRESERRDAEILRISFEGPGQEILYYLDVKVISLKKSDDPSKNEHSNTDGSYSVVQNNEMCKR